MAPEPLGAIAQWLLEPYNLGHNATNGRGHKMEGARGSAEAVADPATVAAFVEWCCIHDLQPGGVGVWMLGTTQVL